jgi:hypothetical protein
VRLALAPAAADPPAFVRQAAACVLQGDIRIRLNLIGA